MADVNIKTPASQLLQEQSSFGIGKAAVPMPAPRNVHKDSGAKIAGAREHGFSQNLIANVGAISCLDTATPNEVGHGKLDIGQSGIAQPVKFQWSEWSPNPAAVVPSASAEFSFRILPGNSWPRNG